MWTIPSYNVKYYAEHPEDRDKILSLKNCFAEEKMTVEEGLLFPGFCGTMTSPDLDRYDKFLKNACTPPRGNYDGLYAIIGIAPGYSEYSFGEPTMLLGPSSETLHRLLVKFDIYPYFTNIFKKAFEDNQPIYEVPDIDKEIIYAELDILFPREVIFLGSYRQYDFAKEYLKKYGMEYHTIFHPSYVHRFDKFDEWMKSFEKVVEKKK
jgi:hypothetical protein